YLIQYKDMTYRSWIYANLPSLPWRSPTPRSNLEIALEFFKGATPVNTDKLLRELVKKQDADVESKLQQDQISKLNYYMVTKIEFELKQIETQKNHPNKPETAQEEKKIVNNTENIIKKLTIEEPAKVVKEPEVAEPVTLQDLFPDASKAAKKKTV